MPLQMSAAGREQLIEPNEGLVLHTYYDSVGVATIGYGITGAEAWPGRVITKAEADQLLSDRLAHEFEPGVQAAIGGAPTAQAEFDAMASLSFNIGMGAFRHSSVLHDHILGNHQAAANAFLLWDKAGGQVLAGLLRRRRQEAAFYLAERPADPAAAPTPRDHIIAAQRDLNAWGLDVDLKVDGLYGPNTSDALKLFQAEAKLPVTGLPDDATLAALRVATPA